MRDEEPGVAWGVGVIFAAGILFVVLIGVMTLVWMQFRPAIMDAEREANVHSHQYVEARRTEILDGTEQCRQLKVYIEQADTVSRRNALRAQRRAIGVRIRRAAALIPEGSRPAGLDACDD